MTENALFIIILAMASTLVWLITRSDKNNIIEGGQGAVTLAGKHANDNIPGRLSRAQILDITTPMHHLYFPDVDPALAATIAMIESSGKPESYRYEPHLKEASYGLMQTLISTARDMHKRGYNAYPLLTGDDLYNPEAGIYYGMAYLDWLQQHYGSEEQKLVRNYNGGPVGFKRTATLAYWNKYKNEKTLINREAVA